MRECFDEGVLQCFNDEELSREEAERVSLHLTHCETCSKTLAELVDANELMSVALAPEFETAVPTERLRQRIDEAIGVLNTQFTNVQPSLFGKLQAWFGSLNFGQSALAYGGLTAVLLFAAVIGVSLFRGQAVIAPLTNDGPTAEVLPIVPAPDSIETASASAMPTESPRANNAGKRVPKRTVKQPDQAVAKVKLLPGEKSYLRTIAALDSTIKANDRPMRPALRAEYERNLALVDRALAAARTAAKNNPDDPDAAEFVFAAYQSKVDLLNTVADARTYNRQQ